MTDEYPSLGNLKAYSLRHKPFISDLRKFKPFDYAHQDQIVGEPIWEDFSFHDIWVVLKPRSLEQGEVLILKTSKHKS